MLVRINKFGLYIHEWKKSNSIPAKWSDPIPNGGQSNRRPGQLPRRSKPGQLAAAHRLGTSPTPRRESAFGRPPPDPGALLQL